ncbi:MAG: dTDP-4-dehydrorhamnose reductase [Actinomycetota bacterium]
MRILVTGAGGQLGHDLALAFGGHETLLADRAILDVTDAAAARALVDSFRPDAVIHGAAWTDVDGCERDPERARLVNVEGTRNVAAAARDAFVVVVSTDYVFDGMLGRAYVEDDVPNPLQVYGQTKLDAERAALDVGARVAIARTAWLYGARVANGEPAGNFVTAILRAASRGTLDVVDDQIGSPTWTGDLARALVSLVERATPGIFHVASRGAVSRADFARAVLRGAGKDPALVRACSTAEASPRPAARPKNAPLEGRAWAAAGFEPLPVWMRALSVALPDILATR